MSDILDEEVDVIKKRVAAQLATLDYSAPWPIREQIALACRFLAMEDHSITLAGQITVRDPGTGHYWTTAVDSGFANMTARQILLIDDQMQVIEGEGIPNPAIRFHLWIYARQPEMAAIVHTHPPHASALGMIGEPLVVSHMDSTMFYDDCAFLPEWPGVPLANEEGRIISEALGSKRSILLAHHGLLTTGKSLQEALYLAILLERSCRMQLLARAAGTIKPLDHELASDAYRFMNNPQMFKSTSNYWMRQAERACPDVLGG